MYRIHAKGAKFIFNFQFSIIKLWQNSIPIYSER